MEILFELILQVFSEALIQGVFELGGRGIVAAVKKDGSPIDRKLAIFGYLVMGAIAGGISIWVLPMQLLNSPLLQILNLAITPILLGFLFELLGRWKTKNEKTRYFVDRFSYGFTFAITMGLVRYAFAV